MSDEPTHDEVREDDNEPVTKGVLRSDLSAMKDEVVKLIADEAEETRRHFDVVAENIHKDVAAANADEISLIKGQQLPDHEERIVDLENEVGLPTGPRHAPLP